MLAGALVGAGGCRCAELAEQRVALRGERFDGHDFAEAAVEEGARAVLIDRAAAPSLAHLDVPRLVVDDTLIALGAMAQWLRN